MGDSIDERMAWWRAVVKCEDEATDLLLDDELSKLLEAIQHNL